MCLGRIAPTRIDYLTQTKRYSKKTSLKQALTIEEAYDNHRMIGLIYCAYNTQTFKYKDKRYDRII